MSAPLSPAARRSALISALRHPETWPAGFQWDFSSCRTCAMGLAAQLLHVGIVNCEYYEACAEPLSISLDDDENLFVPIRLAGINKFNYPLTTITPSMVADRLEILHRELCAKETLDNVEGR